MRKRIIELELALHDAAVYVDEGRSDLVLDLASDARWSADALAPRRTRYVSGLRATA